MREDALPVQEGDLYSGCDGLGPFAERRPARWGRMDLISRTAVVRVGCVLHARGLLEMATGKVATTMTVGLVSSTRRGCLATDLAYCASIRQDPQLASPTLFSYTLANIALSEAASHFGLRGPVYSLYAENDPLGEAMDEAKRWLSSSPGLDAMVAGMLDVPPAGSLDATADATFRFVS